MDTSNQSALTAFSAKNIRAEVTLSNARNALRAPEISRFIGEVTLAGKLNSLFPKRVGATAQRGEFFIQKLDANHGLIWYAVSRNPEVLLVDLTKLPGAAALGRAGGSVKSDAKTKAARANGAMGGRPRKEMEER